MIIIILKLLFFGPYLRRAVGKIVGKKQLVTSMLVRWKKAGNSKQCFSSRLGAEILVVCAAKNLQRKRNVCSKVASCGYNLLILLFPRRIHHIKTDFNDINFLALYWKCAYVGPIFFKMNSFDRTFVALQITKI